ncbi:MAG: thermonuclease family protein [Proteobacteria bacterium]|nr:thermonuclease family protein [Pseudomonadota bacterium]
MLIVVPATAKALPDGLKPGPADVLVAGVVDGDTVVLKTPMMGATQIRLVGIQAPKLALGRKNFPTWPLAAESKALLATLVDGQPLTLSFGGAEKDRHGRLLAHLHRSDGTWIQGEMLKRGMARVYSFADNRSAVADMLALEHGARKAKRGIWGLPYYAVRNPENADELSRLAGTFHLVEGRVADAVRIKGQVYLNFGQDWRKDFTITLNSKVVRLFAKTGVDPLALKGRMVRVRGWLKKYNGPMIEASHPEQIEVMAQ